MAHRAVRFIILAGVLSLLACGPAGDRAAEAGRQPVSSTGVPNQPTGPNLILIVTDDQGQWAMGAYGNHDIVTPNMDRLAREGARFTNAFTASTVCTPSRVALLTGLYPTQVGMTDVPYRRDPDEGLPRGVPAWPRVLQQHGYVTGLIGKWHLGRTIESYPTHFGIDYFFGFLRGVNRPMNPVLWRDGKVRVIAGPGPDILVDDAMQFAEKYRTRPFALMLDFREPHAPHLPVPKADLDALAGVDPQVAIVNPADAVLDDDQEPADDEAIALHTRLLKKKLLAYYASVHAVDRNLGRLMARLDELGMTRNTIIMFTSDNGYMFGQRGLKGKGAAQPIRNHTLANDAMVINMYDPAVRVPLLVRWPGVVKPGIVIDQLVSNIDTFASVLGMLGIPWPQGTLKMGLDFTPLLRGEQVSWRDAVFSQYTPDQIGQIEFIRMIRTQRWKLVRTYLNPGGNQLFDLERDPDELHNLYYRDRQAIAFESDTGQSSRIPHPFAAIRDQLQARLAEWQQTVSDPALALDSSFASARQAARARWQ